MIFKKMNAIRHEGLAQFTGLPQEEIYSNSGIIRLIWRPRIWAENLELRNLAAGSLAE
jgi:hypothetical protein